MDEFVERAAKAQEFRAFARRDLIARPRQPDLELEADAAGMRLEADDAVAEIDRLLQIVGDEENGRLVARAISSISSCRLWRVIASSAPNGSSIISAAGSCARQRAICSRCCMPPDICDGYLSGEWQEADAFEERRDPFAPRLRGVPIASSASETLPSAVRQGSSAFE